MTLLASDKRIEDVVLNNRLEFVQLKIWRKAPAKPRTGQIYFADGTQWNPGSGEGIYLRLAAGTWSKL